MSAGPFASLNLGRGTADAPANVAENRLLAARALGFESLCLPHQVHGAEIRRIRGADQDPGRCDALSSNTSGICLGVLGADCPGLLLVDPVHRALAVVHAGWRGVAATIAQRAVEHLVRTYGSDPDTLRAGIGPGICQEHYEVDVATAEAIQNVLPSTSAGRVIEAGAPGHAYVDLALANELQLMESGIPARHIERQSVCTHESRAHYSHRQDGGRTGRHALLAGWRQP